MTGFICKSCDRSEQTQLIVCAVDQVGSMLFSCGSCKQTGLLFL